MSDYLDFNIRLEEELVRINRKSFYTQLGLFLFNSCFLFIYLLMIIKSSTTFLWLGIGAIIVSKFCSLAFCMNFGDDYRNSKKHLDYLRNRRQDLIQREVM